MENRTDQRVFWHGKLKKESRKTWQATALTALCSVALFCLLFSYKKMYPFGDGSVAITDLYSQYLPLLYHFYDVVTGQKNPVSYTHLTLPTKRIVEISVVAVSLNKKKKKNTETGAKEIYME